MASSSPDRVCISTTNGSIRASTSSGWWTTRSGPSAMIVSSSSVTIVAISTMTSRVWSSPVISRSIHTSTVGTLPSGWHDGRRGSASTKTAFGRALDRPGVVEHAELRGRFGFMAFHGGELERQTDRIAAAAAEASGASLYVVAHPPPDPRTSRRPTCAAGSRRLLDGFLDHVDVVVTVHGYGRDGMFTSLLLGGRNRDLAATLGPRAGVGAARSTRSSPTCRRSRASCAACTRRTR